MKRIVLALVSIAVQGCVQGHQIVPSTFTESALNFSYTPPLNMRDFTEFDNQSIQQRAKAMGKTNTLTLLLSLRSGSDDTAPEWHSIGIQTYPREKMGIVSDRDACQTLSRSVARGGTETGQPLDVQIGAIHFVVSTFEVREGQLTKHACVYTTVRNGKMLSFAFSANSSEVLNKIADSMKTFAPAKAQK